jgi:hypothetical protein
MLKKKILANFYRIIGLFTQKFSLGSQKYGFGIRDPGSRKNLFRIPDPGVKKAPDPGSATLHAFLFTQRLPVLQFMYPGVDPSVVPGLSLCIVLLILRLSTV